MASTIESCEICGTTFHVIGGAVNPKRCETHAGYVDPAPAIAAAEAKKVAPAAKAAHERTATTLTSPEAWRSR